MSTTTAPAQDVFPEVSAFLNSDMHRASPETETCQPAATGVTKKLSALRVLLFAFFFLIELGWLELRSGDFSDIFAGRRSWS